MASNKEKETKNKKRFFKDFKAELKKVIWPTPKQVVNNTTAVITIVLITALIVFVFFVTFETLNTHGVDKLKSVVHKEENTIQNVVDDANNLNTTDTNTVIDNTISE